MAFRDIEVPVAVRSAVKAVLVGDDVPPSLAMLPCSGVHHV